MKLLKTTGSVTPIIMIGALASLVVSLPAAADVTGHLDVVSKYVLRGITTTYGSSGIAGGNKNGDAPESEGPALQGGLDYSNETGFYAGWWFSTLGYSYKSFNDQGTSMEHDLYGGFKGKIGKMGYQIGLTNYHYIPSSNATGYETMLGVSYNEFGLYAQTLLNNVSYGNKGDTYFTATYSNSVHLGALPKDLGVNATLGYYTYTKSDASSFVPAAPNEVNSAFRHATLGVSYPFLKNLSGGLNYIIGGENRYGIKQHNQLVGNVSYTF